MDLAVVILGVLLFGILFVIIEISTKNVIDKLPYTFLVVEEFPCIEAADLNKFNSFDEHLGWERQPNESRKKKMDRSVGNNDKSHYITYTTDDYGSRVSPIARESSDISISTYGDSFCFCREVNDNETLQYHLAKELNLHVSNYGVGNYGLDQSLLRMQRRFPDDPSDYVIMIVSDFAAIPRLVSVWKHYFEFGNTFAVKPRFKLNKNNLSLVKSPISTKSEILDLSTHKQYLREHDHHYNHWFKDHYHSFPYSTFWLRDLCNIPYTSITGTEYVIRNYIANPPFHQKITSIKHYFRAHKYRQQSANMWDYRRILEEEFDQLFMEILAEFTEYAIQHDAEPIFMPIYDPGWQRSEFDVNPLSSDLLNRTDNRCPRLNIIDKRSDLLDSVEYIDDLYVGKKPFLGHPNTFANQANAKYIANHIYEHN